MEIEELVEQFLVVLLLFSTCVFFLFPLPFFSFPSLLSSPFFDLPFPSLLSSPFSISFPSFLSFIQLSPDEDRDGDG